MRVLHFCNYADRIGGAEVYAHAVIAAQRDRGHDVLLFGASPDAERDEPGLRVIRRPPYDPDRLVADPATLAALRASLDRFRPELIHVHNVFSVALEVVAELGRCGVPVLHTVHDYQLLCPNSWCVRGDGSACPGGAGAQCFEHGCQSNYPYDAWSVLLSAVRQQLASDLARIAVVPSTYLGDRLRAHGWRDVRLLPYFVDFAPAAPVARDRDELLYVGRLEREKGVDVLLDAMPRVLAARPATRLTILGGGSQQDALADRARHLGLQHSVRFLSQVPREQLPAFHARAAACVLPSLWTENSPLVAYECLIAGLPMLGSRRGGIPELIEPDCGFTFQPGSAEDLANAALRLLSCSADEHDRMSRAATARARGFAKESHLARLEDVYADCMRAPSPTSAAPFLPLLPVLIRLEQERVHRPRSYMEAMRGIARKLGLPKVLPS